MTEAADYAKAGATPITNQAYSADAANQYLSPYLGDVVQSTQAAQNLQNQQQQQSLQGNITAAGAWGGDRSAVLQSQLAGQQKTADNATIANLYNSGFTQAQGQFNAQNQLNLNTQQANNANNQNTAYSLGNLGTALQNSALSGANAELNAGTLQQQVAQENLNVPYEQYLQQQAYPYQNLSFLAGLLPGVQQGTGTTSTQTTPGANPFSQILGLGATVAGMLKDGGRARRADGGGGLQDTGPSMLDMLESSQMAKNAGGAGSFTPPSVVNAGQSYVPTLNPTTGGASMQGANFGSDAAAQPDNSLSSGATFGKSVYDAFNRNSNANSLDSMDDQVAELTGDPGGASSSGGIGSFFSDLFSHNGGRVANGGRTRLADGGADDDMDPTDPYETLDPRTGMPAGATALSLQDTPPEWRKLATNYAPSPEDESAPAGSFTSDMSDPNAGASLSGSQPTWDDGTPVATDGSAPAANASPSSAWGVQHAAQIMPQLYQAKPDWRRALVTAGAAMMAGQSQNFGENFGKGVQAGVNEYYGQEDKDNHPEVDHSGPTSLIRYADGTVVDTGLPTEAAINAKATSDYRNANMQTLDAQRRAAIDQRRDAAVALNQSRQDAIDQRRDAAADSAANRRTQLEIARMNANPLGAVTAGAGGPNASGSPSEGVHGDEYLKTLPTAISPQVKALADGRMQFPTGMALSKPYWQSMLQAVSQYDPSFDAVNYNARSGTRKWITSGQGANTVTALNTALGHASRAQDALAKLGNGSFPSLNSARNFLKTEFGDSGPTNANEVIDALSSEGRKVFAASGGGNLTELENWKKNFPINGSPEQQQGALSTFVDLLDSRLSSVGDQYNRGMGKTEDRLNLLSPDARNSYIKLTGRKPESGAVAGQHDGPGTAPLAGGSGGAPTVTTKAQFDALAPNTVYTGKDGNQYRKP